MQNDHSQQTITSNGMPLGNSASPTRIIPIESQGESNHAHPRKSDNRSHEEIAPDESQLLSVSLLDKIEIDLEQGKGVPLASADQNMLNAYRSALRVLIKSYKMKDGLPLRTKAENNDERAINSKTDEIHQ